MPQRHKLSHTTGTGVSRRQLTGLAGGSWSLRDKCLGVVALCGPERWMLTDGEGCPGQPRFSSGCLGRGGGGGRADAAGGGPRAGEMDPGPSWLRFCPEQRWPWAASLLQCEDACVVETLLNEFVFEVWGIQREGSRPSV